MTTDRAQSLTGANRRRDYALGVCGFPRCGSSMTMRMLDAGGLAPISGSSLGSYELPGLEGLEKRPAVDLIGRAIKLLDYVQWYGVEALPSVPWRFVWLHRDHRQQAKSFVKFTSFVGLQSTPDAERRLVKSYRDDEAPIANALSRTGAVLVLNFEDVLAEPLFAARKLQDFCGIDPEQAAAVVHHRSPECRPDMAVELAALEGVS